MRIPSRLLSPCAALALVACGSSDPAPTQAAASPAHAMAMPTDPDPSRAFALGMIEHHRGAVVMSEEALRGPLDPEMRALATKIIGDQQREITQMEDYLRRSARH